MRLLLIILTTIMMLTIAITTGYANELCLRAEAIRAEGATDHLQDWNAVYRWYKRYKHCDDGAISEGYSDKIGKLLANDWKTFPVLYRLSANDNHFKSFILKHLDDTISMDVYRAIIENASKKCPEKMTKLCKSIIKKAKE
jgi:hypothetical protein